MTVTEITDDLNGTLEQKKRFVAQFNLMDDTFFSVVMENKDACEYLLTALLGRPVKYIRSNKTQFSINNGENHSIVLDALIEDQDKNKYNIEVQVNDHKNCERRIRYYRSAIDQQSLGKGEDYSKLPDVYMIFISSFDPFGEDKNRYEVKKYLDSGSEYNDGEHILYFNTAVDDGTDLSRLLQYMANSSADIDDFGALSQAVRYHKVNDEGVEYMCRIVDDYGVQKREEGIAIGEIKRSVEVVNSMLADKINLDTALRYAKIDKNTYEKYKNNN